jgi:hypothetical protein
LSDRLQLAGHVLAYLALLSALGSGIVVPLATRLRWAPVLAPLAGLAIAAAVLTSATYVMPMKAAAWGLLVPGAVISTAVAARAVRRGARLAVAELAPALALVVVGIALGVLPGLVRGTQGPLALAVYDGWGYVHTDGWLQSHTTNGATSPEDARYDLSELYGWATAQGNARIGVSAVNAAVATVFHANPDVMNLVFLSVLFGLAPSAIFATVRGLGGGRGAALGGAVLGLSPALYTLVADSTLGNLAGVVLLAPLLLLGARWLLHGWRPELLATAALAAGLLALYPEYVAPSLVIAAAGVGWMGLEAVRERRLVTAARSIAPRLVALAALSVALAPIATERTVGYLAQITGDPGAFAGLPPRFLTGENGAAWAFGTVHLYQLPRFDLIQGFGRVVAIGLPIALAVAIALGLARSGARRAVLVTTPVAVAIVLGLLAYRRYQGGACGYCLWKSLTYMLPFLGVGLGLAIAAGLRVVRGRRLARPALTLGLAGLVALTGAAIGRADAKLVRAQEYTPAVVTADLRALADDGKRLLPAGPRILVEGGDATVAPKWSTPGTYWFARGIRDAKVSVLPLADSGAYLGLGVESGGRLWDPGYEYVLTSFPGIRRDRERIAMRGTYALDRRGRIDVAIARTGWAVDPAEGAGAIPWLAGAFELWISAPPDVESVAVDLGFARPQGDVGTVFFAAADGELGALRSTDGSHACVDVPLTSGAATVSVQPAWTVPFPVPGRLTESDPVPPPTKLLGLAELRASATPCAASSEASVPVIRFGAGFEPAERDPNGVTFRWMGTSGILTIAEAGQRRPRLRFEAGATSLAVERMLTIRLGETVLFDGVVPAGSRFVQVSFEIPAGEGAAELVADVTPPAQPAADVNPADPRTLAISLANVRLTRVSG